MKYIASVSFGKDSLAMLLRLMDEDRPLDAVVFYDTGMEFDAIYRVRDKVLPLLEERNIDYAELHPEEPFLFSMFERKIKYKNKPGYHYGYGWCGGVCRWGTSGKISAIKKFKSSLHDTVVDYVGIAADEPDRFEKAKREDKRLPLVQWGMKESDCLAYCRSFGWNWIEHTENGDVDLYDVLTRVSCWCCRNKNLNELRAIYKYLPEYWARIKDVQSKLDSPMKGDGCSVFDLERRFELEAQWQLSGRKIGTRDFYVELKKLQQEVAQ